MMSHRRHSVVLVLLLGIAALVAQLAGVGGTAGTARKAPSRATLSVVPGGAVPDVSSTRLATSKRAAAADEVVRMRGEASIVARSLGSAGVAQVVCGLRYSRDDDASWTLGTPYETVVLTKATASEHVVIERSFTAPEADTYRASVACHVSSPARGARVTASGETRLALGLPDGAAIPSG